MAPNPDNAMMFQEWLSRQLGTSDDRKSLADHLGVDVSTVSRWLGGKTAPELFRAPDVAAYFSANPQFVFDLIARSQGSKRTSTQELAARLEAVEIRLDALSQLIEDRLRDAG
jgi:transcriptional regulator with XRE-family HTH domain